MSSERPRKLKRKNADLRENPNREEVESSDTIDNVKAKIHDKGSVRISNELGAFEIMIFLGFNAAISVRISNELGAGRPRAAKFAILLVVISSVLIGLAFVALVLALQDVYALPFTNSPDVIAAISKLTNIFAFTLLLNSVQPVLTGVATLKEKNYKYKTKG